MRRDEVITYCLFFLLIIVYFLFPQWELGVLMMVWAVSMSYCLIDIKERLLLLIMNVTIFTFLITQMILPCFFMTDYIEENLGIRILYNFSTPTMHMIHTSIVLAIMFLFVGFSLVRKENVSTLQIDPSSPYVQRVRSYAMCLSIIGAVCTMLYVAERIMYVLQYGYFGLYVEYESSLPGIVQKFSQLYKPLFFLYLATLPDRKYARWMVLMFLLLAIFTLFTGSRTEFMLDLILVLVYYLLRNRLSPDKPWLSKRAIGIGLLLAPLLLVAMFLLSSLRSESESEQEGISIMDLFINFFYQQGLTVQVLGLTHDMQDVVHDGRLFSFGKLIDSFRANGLFRIFGMGVEYKPQTEEMALYGHSLANTLSYHHVPDSFLGGYGLGTCYLAEIWNDFGYVGIALWNIVYGYILAQFNNWSRRNIWLSAISLIMILHIFYAPRGYAIAFLTESVLSPSIVAIFVLIHVAAYIFTYSPNPFVATSSTSVKK